MNPRPKTELIGPNHFVIKIKNRRYLQSYDTIIAGIIDTEDKKLIYLDKDNWNYSKSTARWRNKFLEMTNAEVNIGVVQGKFIMKDLNNKSHGI